MYHRLRLIAAARRAKQDARKGEPIGQIPYDDPALRRRYYRSYVAWRDVYREKSKCELKPPPNT